MYCTSNKYLANRKGGRGNGRGVPIYVIQRQRRSQLDPHLLYLTRQDCRIASTREPGQRQGSDHGGFIKYAGAWQPADRSRSVRPVRAGRLVQTWAQVYVCTIAKYLHGTATLGQMGSPVAR